MRLLSLSVASLFALASSANAEEILKKSELGPMVSAAMLYTACTQENPTLHCDPYIAGVLDSITSNGGELENNRLCITPDQGRIENLRAITVNYIKARQQNLPPATTIAASVVATALTEAFPCPKGQ